MFRLNQVNNNLPIHHNHNINNVNNNQNQVGVRRAREEANDIVDINPAQRPRIGEAAYQPNIAQLHAANITQDFERIVDNAITLFNEGKRAISAQLQQITSTDEVILFVGNTGAGKSTLINYLSGCTLTARQDGLSWVINVQNPVTDIGNDGTRAATFLPTLCRDVSGNTNRIYCDLPGFNDTRGLAQKLANACLIREAAARASGIKVVVVVSLDSLRSTEGRVENFQSCIEQIVQLIPSLNDSRSSISLVVTKAEATTSIEGVQGLLQEVSDDNRVLQEATHLIGNNISFFREPQQEGVIEHGDRNSIINQVNHRQVIRGAELRVPISNEMRASIRNLATEINNRITELSTELGFDLRELVAESDSYRRLPELYRNLQELRVAEIMAFYQQIGDIARNLGVALDNMPAFTQITNSVNRLEFLNMITNERLDQANLWLENLRRVCDDIDSSFDDGALTIKGKYILTSQVARLLNNNAQETRKINIYSTGAVIGDQDLRFPGGNVEIISLSCKSVSLNLDGNQGPDHEEISAPAGSSPGAKGKNGKPGLPGYSGGNIIAILYNTTAYPHASVNGGKGGRGQNGGHGAAGKNGIDAPQRSDNDIRAPSMKWINNIVLDRDLLPEPSYPGLFTIIRSSIQGNQKWYEIDFSFLPATNGTSGGNGGQRGQGGLGGLPGSGIALSLSNDRGITTLADRYGQYRGSQGEKGKDGESGKPGEGGKHGRHIKCNIYVEYTTTGGRYTPTNKRVNRDYVIPNPAKAPNGTTESGTNREGIRQPIKQQISSPSTYNYINYLQDHINNTPQNRLSDQQRNFLELLRRYSDNLYNIADRMRG